MPCSMIPPISCTSDSWFHYCFVDDGAYYFDDKHIDASGHQGPLSATSAVVRGLTAFAATSGSLNVRYTHALLPQATFPVNNLFLILLKFCRYLRTRFWVWQGFSLALEFLETARTCITKLTLYLA